MTTTKTIQVGDIEVFYHEAGAGPELILLHGGIVTTEMMWARRIPELAAAYHVTAPDTRGHGRTTNPSGHLSYAQMADDVAGLITALGLTAPHIVGYSDGGQAALEFAIRHPGKARSLVLGGTISSASPKYLEMIRDWGFPSPGTFDEAKLREAWGDFVDEIKTMHGTKPDYWRTFLPQIATLWLTVPNYTDAQLASIVDPVLVLMGDRDNEEGLDHALRLYRGIPGSQLGLVPGSPHGAADRDIFWAMVRDFHQRLGS